MLPDEPSYHHRDPEPNPPQNIAELQQELIKLRQKVSWQTLLNPIVQAMRGTLVLEEVLQTTVDRLHQTLNVSRCLIFRPDPDHHMTAYHVSEATVAGESLIGVYCDFYRFYHPQLSQGEAVILGQIDRSFPTEVTESAEKCGIRAILIVPLLYQNSYIGGISLHQCDRQRHWTADEIAFVQTIADHCAIALDQAALYQQLQTELAERQQAEKTLRKQEELFRRLAETTNVIPWEADLSTWKFTYVGPQAVRLLGYPLEDWYSDPQFWIDHIHPDDRHEAVSYCQQKSSQYENHEFEYRMIAADGRIVWIRDVVNIIKEEGDSGKLLGFFLDITERKQIEEQLRTSLQQKELLLQEIHHRVKNNLQVVSSLLDLQSDQLSDPQTLELLQESHNRIKSMSLIHQELYYLDHQDRINFVEYIKNLINQLIRTYAINPRNITLQLNIEDIPLDLDTAIPCGLILNELVANALKHSFSGKAKGSIWVTFKLEGEQITLVIGNDTLNFTEPLDLTQTKAIGLQLVQALVEQLDGEIKMEQNPSTVFQIRFRLPQSLRDSLKAKEP